MHHYIMALDQGTTSSRAIIFDETGSICAVGQRSFPQHYPNPGWVEHDPYDILRSQFEAMNESLELSGLAPGDICAIGITNQRETTVVWDRNTGKPVYNAIVWQCRRTADYCEELKTLGYSGLIMQKTGLLIDAYFSGTKINWILNHIDGTKERAERGELMFGTIDSWLIYNLTGNHYTDYSNACRTMLFNIDSLTWDEELCRLLNIPMNMLPCAVPNSYQFGRILKGIPGAERFAGIPICSSIGDQQSALLGQGCIESGQAKNTYGTGCFTLLNSGSQSVRSRNGLLTCIGWQLDGKTTYVMEGSIFNAGSSIQWLRDELGVISSAHECDTLAESVSDTGGVYMVSAFTGLGAPYWDMYARGIICGITRGTTRAHLARAVLEGIAYQVKDMLDAMEEVCGEPLAVLKVDGGASVSDFLMQFQADILQKPIERPKVVETTALGAAFLAGYTQKVWHSVNDIHSLRTVDRLFNPIKTGQEGRQLFEGWKHAVERSRDWAKEN